MNHSLLSFWPEAAVKPLLKLIQHHAHQGEYAVFDMDNTSYLYDISDYMLAYFEHHQIITRETLPSELVLIPFQDDKNHYESLYAYCHRLRKIDRLICFPWMTQILAGLSLAQLKQYVDAALHNREPLKVHYLKVNEWHQHIVHPPLFLRGMQQLYQLLQQNGIEVFVITASSEELVRCIACDPQYGYHVKDENVLGANLLLKDPHTNNIVVSRSLEHSKGLNPSQCREHLELTGFLVAPMTWFEGKAGTILAWIDRVRQPILVAGDSALSDGFMLLNSTNVAQGGLRIWVDHGSQQTAKMLQLRQQSLASQQNLRLATTADDNWLIVTPQQII